MKELFADPKAFEEGEILSLDLLMNPRTVQKKKSFWKKIKAYLKYKKPSQ